MTRSDFKSAVEEILELPRGALKDSDDRESIPTWTSLADVQILTFITSEFGLEPEAEMMEAATFGDLVRQLEDKRVLS